VSRLLHVIGSDRLACRTACGACCIAPSIATVPGMEGGKPAGVRCIHLSVEDRCALFGLPERPPCCGGLQPSHEMCGETRAYAMTWLAELERATS
jgi:uncharacterized protein